MCTRTAYHWPKKVGLFILVRLHSIQNGVVEKCDLWSGWIIQMTIVSIVFHFNHHYHFSVSRFRPYTLIVLQSNSVMVHNETLWEFCPLSLSIRSFQPKKNRKFVISSEKPWLLAVVVVVTLFAIYTNWYKCTTVSCHFVSSASFVHRNTMHPRYELRVKLC